VCADEQKKHTYTKPDTFTKVRNCPALQQYANLNAQVFFLAALQKMLLLLSLQILSRETHPPRSWQTLVEGNVSYALFLRVISHAGKKQALNTKRTDA
jgi:hypothetical protein